MPNGVIAPSELTLVQYGLYLPHRAAHQWAALKAQVQAETGVVLQITYSSSWPTPPKEIGGLGAWRSLACQTWMYANKGNRQCAKPGNSVHGVAAQACVDILNHAAVPRTTLERIARENGWIPNTVAKEPWHFRYNGTTISGGGDLIPVEELMSMFDDTVIAGGAKYWLTPLYGAIPLTLAEATAIDAIKAAAPDGTVDIAHVIRASELIRRAANGWLIPAIDAVISDEDTLAAIAAIPPATGGSLTDADIARIAAATQATLTDEFAVVNKNIDDQPTEFVITPKG